jgi:hypothetical protein
VRCGERGKDRAVDQKIFFLFKKFFGFLFPDFFRLSIHAFVKDQIFPRDFFSDPAFHPPDVESPRALDPDTPLRSIPNHIYGK